MQAPSITEMIDTSNRHLGNKIVKDPTGPLHNLLPPTRTRQTHERGHNFVLPHVRTERFRRIFENRYLFNFI